MLFSSSAQDPEFVAGIIKHVSSAHLTISFPARVGLRSAAVIKYDGGPIPDPCIILAVTVATEDVTYIAILGTVHAPSEKACNPVVYVICHVKFGNFFHQRLMAHRVKIALEKSKAKTWT